MLLPLRGHHPLARVVVDGLLDPVVADLWTADDAVPAAHVHADVRHAPAISAGLKKVTKRSQKGYNKVTMLSHHSHVHGLNEVHVKPKAVSHVLRQRELLALPLGED